MSAESTVSLVPSSWDRPRFDILILLPVLFLIGVGIIFVYSSSSWMASQKLGDTGYFMRHQVVYAVMGVGAMALLMRVGYQRLQAFAYPFLGICLFLTLLTLVPGLGARINGAQRWIRLPGLTFQPTEFLKLAFCVYMAKSLSEKDSAALKSFRVGLLPHLVVLAVAASVVLLQPDFGTAMVLGVVAFVMLFVAGVSLKWLFGGGVGLALCAVILVASSDYRMRRVEAYLDPFQDRLGKGYQVIEAMVSVYAGGVVGQGLGEGNKKYGFLPEGHTDYILASIGEEEGLVGIAVVLGLFGLLIWRGWRATRDAPDPFGVYLAFALTSLFAVEVAINSWMCLGLLPSKGLALPFVSYGGTSLLKATAAAGILLSISGGGGGYLTPAEGATRCE